MSKLILYPKGNDVLSMVKQMDGGGGEFSVRRQVAEEPVVKTIFVVHKWPRVVIISVCLWI